MKPKPEGAAGIAYIIHDGAVGLDRLCEAVSNVSGRAEIEVMDTDAVRLIARHVETGRAPDLIIASSGDPEAFWVRSLLSIAVANFPDLPLLVVGDKPAEKVAHAYQDAGAWLYIEADRLATVQEEIRWALGEGTDLEPPRPAARHIAERLRLMMREAQRVMRLVLHSSERVFVRKRDGTFLYASEAAAVDFGTEAGEIPGKNDIDIWGEEIGARCLQADLDIMAAGESVREWREDSLELFEKTPILDDAGEVCALVVVKSYPTERALGWQELVPSANMARTFPDALVGIEADDTVECWNPGARGIYGYEEHEAVGMDLLELAAPESRDELERTLAQVREDGSVQRRRMVHRRNDGSPVHVEALIWPLVGEMGEWRICHMVTRDISPQVAREREMQEALEHVSRAARQLGQFADASATTPQPHGYHEADIEQVAREVRADPCAEHDFQEAARRCHLSYGYFRRLFRRYTGRPPYDYMLLWRMRRAARALRDLNKPVKAVADEVGYDEPRQFSRMFKKQMGMSPTAFRQSLTARH